MNYLFIMAFAALSALGIISPDSTLSEGEIKSLTNNNRQLIENHNESYKEIFNEEQWN